MGKRNRKQKKEATSFEANAVPVPDKSPRICEEKPNFSEFKVGANDKCQSPAKDDKSNKITSYFPRSPEGRLQPPDPPTEAAARAIQTEDSLAFLPPLGLLTPDTTPTKDISQPPPRSTQHCDPSPPHHRDPSPSHHKPAETQKTRGELSDRPKAAHRLEYGAAASREESGGLAEGKMGGAKIKEGVAKTEDGKPRQRRKARSKKSKQVKQSQSPSTTLKDYFPVRRSNRRCKSTIEAEDAKRLHEAVLTGQEEGVEVRNIVDKGRGVIATRAFKKGDFVVEYHGDHIDVGTAKQREGEYAANPSIGCYMYYYQYKNKSYCVDATAESGRIGRLLNHSKSGNCSTRLISIDDQPYLILVATRPISIDEELLYDYGDRNKESLDSHPWLAL